MRLWPGQWALAATGQRAPLRLRPVRGPVDLWRLWQWRHDPSVVRAFFNPPPKTLLEHLRWCDEMRKAPDVQMFMATADGHVVGHGRFHVTDKFGAGADARFSVMVAPAHRGRGHGTQLVRALVVKAVRAGCVQASADIRPDNTASLHAFTSSGFVERFRTPAVVHLTRRLP